MIYILILLVGLLIFVGRLAVINAIEASAFQDWLDELEEAISIEIVNEKLKASISELSDEEKDQLRRALDE